MPTLPSVPTMPSQQTALLKGNSELDLSQAAHLLSTGSIVAFPTETVYGLGANAHNTHAVSRIFSAKNRPADNPLIVHVSSLVDLKNLTAPLLPAAAALASAFWPGPLTLVLPLLPSAKLSPLVTAGLRTVAVRIPRHPVAAALLAKAGVPVAAPSANLSGRPSPTCARHVMTDLGGRIEAVVDGGEVDVGVESTVVAVENEVRVLRLGGISVEDVERVTGCKVIRGGDVEKPMAPGMKYRHYAPRAKVNIVDEDDLERWVGKGIGLLAEREVCEKWSGKFVCVPCGGGGDVEWYARELYAGLRAFDGEGQVQENVEVILAIPPGNIGGVGEAVMERLMKAAKG